MIFITEKGFSLIELSIVLIIIGLLVAGVTGGSSLINSARMRALITELENNRRLFYSFYALNGDLPRVAEGSTSFGYFDGFGEYIYKMPF